MSCCLPCPLGYGLSVKFTVSGAVGLGGYPKVPEVSSQGRNGLQKMLFIHAHSPMYFVAVSKQGVRQLTSSSGKWGLNVRADPVTWRGCTAPQFASVHFDATLCVLERKRASWFVRPVSS